MDAATIAQLDRKNMDEETRGTEQGGAICAICRMDVELGEEIIVLPCPGRHWFHTECCVSWLEESRTCPYCRAALPGVDPCKFCDARYQGLSAMHHLGVASDKASVIAMYLDKPIKAHLMQRLALWKEAVQLHRLVDHARGLFFGEGVRIANEGGLNTHTGMAIFSIGNQLDDIGATLYTLRHPRDNYQSMLQQYDSPGWLDEAYQQYDSWLGVQTIAMDFAGHPGLKDCKNVDELYENLNELQKLRFREKYSEYLPEREKNHNRDARYVLTDTRIQLQELLDFIQAQAGPDVETLSEHFRQCSSKMIRQAHTFVNQLLSKDGRVTSIENGLKALDDARVSGRA